MGIGKLRQLCSGNAHTPPVARETPYVLLTASMYCIALRHRKEGSLGGLVSHWPEKESWSPADAKSGQ